MISGRRKILFLQKRLLFPTNTGGKIRTLNVLRHLARWHDITYLCNLLEEEKPYVTAMEQLGLRVVTVPWQETPRSSPKFYCQLAMNLLSRYPFNVNKDFDPRVRDRAREMLAAEDYDLLICDFVQMARNVLDLAGPPKLLFEHNVEAQIFQRHSKTDEGMLRRKYMHLQWKKMQRFEAEAGRQFDGVVAVSEQDKAIYHDDYGWDHVHVIDTSVDTDFFAPGKERQVAGRCAFVGSMDWLPNQDGVQHFVNKVWPKVVAAIPQASFQIVGRNPSPAIQRLAEQPGVEVTGSVEDIRPYMAQAEVVVVPLLVGGGTRLKIYEAMAMRKAIVSTPLGAEGLDVTDGENLLLCEAGEEFADKVIELLQDRERRDLIAQSAFDLVVNNYSAEAVARQFDDICRHLMAKGGNESN